MSEYQKYLWRRSSPQLSNKRLSKTLLDEHGLPTERNENSYSPTSSNSPYLSSSSQQFKDYLNATDSDWNDDLDEFDPNDIEKLKRNTLTSLSPIDIPLMSFGNNNNYLSPVEVTKKKSIDEKTANEIARINNDIIRYKKFEDLLKEPNIDIASLLYTELEQNQNNSLPRDAKVIKLILKTMGIYNVESRVIQQLLEFSHRYASDVLQDALAFSEHAGHNEVNESDIRLAIEGKSTYSFTNPPSRDVLEEIAARRNKLPLPIIQEKYGVRLPPERHCLTAINYQVIPQKVTVKQESKQEQTTTNTTQNQQAQTQPTQMKIPPSSTVPPARINSTPSSVLPNSSVLPTLPGQSGLPLSAISNPLSSSLLNSNLSIGMPPFIGGNLLGVRFPDSMMSSVLFPPSQLPTQTSTAKAAASSIKSEDDYDEKAPQTTTTSIKTEPKSTTSTTPLSSIKTEPK